ncbi:MAG: hypothetical protein WD533_01410 [Dehalococcoidia bacterium]
MITGRADEKRMVLGWPEWLRNLARYYLGTGPVTKRCGNCEAQMALVEERVWELGRDALYGVRAWDCSRCEHETETGHVFTWPSDA